MGLDQYAYSKSKDGKKTDLAEWRKHPNLQGWMQRLWESKGRPNEHEDTIDFNCVNLPLTEEDINQLEADVVACRLPSTSGFFYGSDADDYYWKTDLAFIEKAREALSNGEEVTYGSWW